RSSEGSWTGIPPFCSAPVLEKAIRILLVAPANAVGGQAHAARDIVRGFEPGDRGRSCRSGDGRNPRPGAQVPDGAIVADPSPVDAILGMVSRSHTPKARIRQSLAEWSRPFRCSEKSFRGYSGRRPASRRSCNAKALNTFFPSGRRNHRANGTGKPRFFALS